MRPVEQRRFPPLRGRQQPWRKLQILLLATIFLSGPRCEPAPNPRLLDERGDPDQAGFAALVSSVETTRGLDFIQRPRLVIVPPDSPELSKLSEKTVAGRSASSTPAAPGEPTVRVLPDFERNLVVAVSPLDPRGVRGALGRLLDAQHYPRLVALAPRLTGDPAIAVQALLAASAAATAGGSWFRGHFRGEPVDPFAAAAAPEPGAADARIRLSPEDFARVLLLQLDDPELAFRRPPLSTKQLMSARAFLSSDRPIRLLGTPPDVPGCTCIEDESLGVYRLLGGELSPDNVGAREALASWQGDRLLEYACDDGPGAWLYVVQLGREADAATIEPALDRLLPRDLSRPFRVLRKTQRLLAVSGLDLETARRFGMNLEGAEVKELEDFLP